MVDLCSKHKTRKLKPEPKHRNPTTETQNLKPETENEARIGRLLMQEGLLVVPWRILDLNPNQDAKIRRPEPTSRNPKFETRSQKSDTRNLKWKPKPETRIQAEIQSET